MVNKTGRPKGPKQVQLRVGITQVHKTLLGPDGFRSYHLRKILDEYPILKAENERLKVELEEEKAYAKSLEPEGC